MTTPPVKYPGCWLDDEDEDNRRPKRKRAKRRRRGRMAPKGRRS